MGLRYLLLVMILGSSALAGIHFATEDASAAQATVTVEFDAPFQLIDCGPGDNCVAIFKGRVLLDPVNNPTYREGQLSRFDITLSATSTDPTYLYSVLPQVFSIEASPTWGRRYHDIQLTVRAPLMAPADPEGVQVSVTGTWMSFPNMGLGSGTIPPQSVRVEARPYYRILVSSDPVFVKRLPGSVQSFRVDIYNMGTSADQVQVMALPPEGWAVEVSTPLVAVPAQSNTSVVVTVHSAQRLDPWRQKVSEVTITFRSEQAWQAGKDVSTVYSLYMYEWGVATINYFHWACWAVLGIFFIVLLSVLVSVLYARRVRKHGGKLKFRFGRGHRGGKGGKRLKFHLKRRSGAGRSKTRK